MYIRKKHISRRMVLRGVGATIALPFLDAMVPAATALADTAAAPKPKLGFFYLPHGAVMDRWTPTRTGTDFDFPYILETLAPYKQYTTVVSGLDNPAGGGVVHAVTPGTWLGCVPPERTHAPNGATTLDQIAGRIIGQDTPLPVIEMAVEEAGGANACDGTYGCSFGNTISFSSPTTPLPMEYNPRRNFERLFGRGATPEERQAIAADFNSVLDMVAEEAGALRRDLAAPDRVVLDSYLDSVREIERRVANMDAQGQDADLPQLPSGVPDFDERLRLTFDMIAAAYQANLTRVVAFMMAAEVSNSPYPQIGIPDAFHPLSHHANNPAQMVKLSEVQRYHTDVFVEFLDKISDMSDGENSVLENAIFLYGSNMSDSNAHNRYPLPSLVIGKGCGTIKGGQHLDYGRAPLANLLLTLANRAGVPMQSFGDSTGELSEI